MKRKEINYRKAAFQHPWNLSFLAVAMASALVFSVVLPPSASTAVFNSILVLAAGTELLVLGILPNNKRFQNIIKARWAKERAKPPSSRELFEELGRDNQRRYIRLRELQKKIEANYRKFSYASQGLLDSHIKKIGGLLESCLTMMHQQERLRLYASAVREQEVLDDMVQLQQDMEEITGPVQRVKMRRFKVLEHRLARFKKSQSILELLTEQIETLEDVVDYVHEQSMTLQNPEQISFQLDVLMTDIQETESSLGPIESAFGDADFAGFGELDLLGLDSAPTQTDAAPRQRTR